jgi:hypothetical protein
MPARKRKAAPAKPKTKTESRHPLMRPKGPAECAALERLRKICLALPEASEKIAWGEPTWRAPKIFAQMDTHHHGAEHVAVWLAVPPGLQEALIEEDPRRFFRPPYVGSKGWVGVRIDAGPDWKVVASVVRDAHAFIASSR